MKLLFLTQVLDGNDAVLGFVNRWVRGLAASCESVRVVALEVGDTSDLPNNVDWRVVGRRGRVLRYLRYQRYLREALGRDGFDTVLAHMVPRYSLLADRAARRHGAGHFLWYTHAGVDERLRRAVARVDRVFTASDESLRIETPKKLVTGHGIDLAHFATEATPVQPARLLSVGRLTPKKDPLTVFAAMQRLLAEGRDVHLDWVGAGLTEADVGYRREVEQALERGGLGPRVHLLGAVPYRDVASHYADCTCLINASHTGSLDKVVLEAMASGRPFVSCNDSAPAIVAELGPEAPAFWFEPGDSADLHAKLAAWLDRNAAGRAAVGRSLRTIVERDHEVDRLMERLVREMGERPS